MLTGDDGRPAGDPRERMAALFEQRHDGPTRPAPASPPGAGAPFAARVAALERALAARERALADRERRLLQRSAQADSVPPPAFAPSARGQPGPPAPRRGSVT